MKKNMLKIVCTAISASVMLISSVSQAFAAFTLGDVNNNGFIDAVDASLILAEYAASSTEKGGSFTAEQKKAGDVNHDDQVDAVDASKILSYYAYKSTSGTLDLETFINDPPATTTTTAVKTTTSTTTTTTAITTTTTYNPPKIDYSKDIIGFWEMQDEDEEDTDKLGLFFLKDGTGGIYDITSDLFHFSGNDFVVSGTVIPSPLYQEKDGTIIVDNGEEKLLEMSRIESTDGKLGTYHLYDGMYYNIILNGFKSDRNTDVDPLYAVVDFYEDGKSRIVYKNFFTYKLDGNILSVTTNENLTPIFNGDGAITINKNTMIMLGGNEVVSFTRKALPTDEMVMK
jgi:hypothetical protein